MDETLDRDARVAVYNERARLMRAYLPITPLASPAFDYSKRKVQATAFRRSDFICQP